MTDRDSEFYEDLGSEDGFGDLRQRAQDAFQHGLETARFQAVQAREMAEEQLEQAQKYVAARIVERPLTAALVALGAGVVIGLALSSRRER